MNLDGWTQSVYNYLYPVLAAHAWSNIQALYNQFLQSIGG